MIEFFKSILSPFLMTFRFIRSLIVYRIRIDGILAVNFFDMIKRDGWVYAFDEEYVFNGLPRQFDGFGLLDRTPLRLSIQERLLRTGFKSTDTVIYAKFFRFQKEKVFSLLRNCNTIMKDEVPVFIVSSWGEQKLGILKGSKKLDEPYIDSIDYIDLDTEIQAVVNKEKEKTGSILYGLPGNGKSYLIRHFALKYELPIYIVSFDTNWTNTDIIRNFNAIKGPAIVLLEDFDNYFDKRKPRLKLNFSLDAILNVLDGAFTVFDNIIFFMTANDIGKVDYALKQRPSRFKFCKEISVPNKKMRERIFDNVSKNGIINKTEGYSLDMLLLLRDNLLSGADETTTLKNLKIYDEYLKEYAVWKDKKILEEAEKSENEEDKPIKFTMAKS